MPGVTLNFSRSGISTTVGVPGASINLGKKGAYLNTGIPGTGLYDRKRIGGSKKRAGAGTKAVSAYSGSSYPSSFSDPAGIKREVSTGRGVSGLTTPGLESLRETLESCLRERYDIRKEILRAEKALKRSRFWLTLSRIFLIGFFISFFRRNKEEDEAYIQELHQQLHDCVVDLDIHTDEDIFSAFADLSAAYEQLLSCGKVWDVTGWLKVDQLTTRSGIAEKMIRKPVALRFADPEIIRSRFKALHFQNANGGDMYLYPAFAVITSSSGFFGVKDIRELNISFQTHDYPEEGTVPEDAQIVGNTWAKVNKDGTPDRRFRDNYAIPVCRYGILHFTSSAGLNEIYCLSNAEKAADFNRAFSAYLNRIGPA